MLNLRAVYDSSALHILMTCAAAWMRAMIEADSDEENAKRIVVVDEAWRIFSHLGVGEWLQDAFKHSRAYGVQNVVVMHRLSDLRSAGAEGSREARQLSGSTPTAQRPEALELTLCLGQSRLGPRAGLDKHEPLLLDQHEPCAVAFRRPVDLGGRLVSGPRLGAGAGRRRAVQSLTLRAPARAR